MTGSFGKTAVNAGLVLGVVMVLVSHAGYLWGNLGTSSWVGYLNWLGDFVVLYYFIRHYREKYNGGYLEYWKGVGLGMMTALLSAIVYALYFIILIKADPHYLDQILQLSADALVQSGFKENEVDKMMKMSAELMTPVTILFSSFLSSGILGFIISLIVSAILRKNKPIFES